MSGGLGCRRRGGRRNLGRKRLQRHDVCGELAGDGRVVRGDQDQLLVVDRGDRQPEKEHRGIRRRVAYGGAESKPFTQDLLEGSVECIHDELFEAFGDVGLPAHLVALVRVQSAPCAAPVRAEEFE